MRQLADEDVDYDPFDPWDEIPTAIELGDDDCGATSPIHPSQEHTS